MVSLGDKLGLYKAMAGAGPLSSQEVARRSGCGERYVREWLNAQVAGGYVDYHPTSATYELTPEQAAVLADDTSPVFLPHAWQVVASMWADEPKSRAAFKAGRGVSWGEHDERLFCGVAAFYRNAYSASLVKDWLPALTGVTDKLEKGAKVADVGCGHGHSTVLMAKAFPKSRFWGFDVHEGSIAAARQVAREAGVADRVSFEVARADDYAKRGYDLICFFDCLHDMGRPVDAVRHAASGDGRGRHADADRAVRRRPGRGQHQSGRPALLCRIDDDVLRPRDLGERHPRPRRPGGAAPARGRAEVGRARHGAQGGRDAVQSDHRGASMINRPDTPRH